MFQFGDKHMGGLRGKLLVALIVYFGGFATAIYYQAPALDDSEITARQMPAGGLSSENEESTRAEILAKKVHENFLEYYSIAEDKASKVGALLKAKLNND
jgi:hypothetical protein